MSFRTVIRLSGMALIGGGILLAIGSIISSLMLPEGLIGMYSSPLAILAYALRIVGAVLLLLGLPAVFARQAQGGRSIVLSLIGFLLLFLGIAMLEIGMNSIYAFMFPPMATSLTARPVLLDLDAHRPLGASIAYTIGLVLETFGPLVLGIAILRAKVLPRLAGVMFVVVPLLFILSLPDFLLFQAIVGVILAGAIGLGFVFCGYGLLSYQKQEQVRLG
ncbi:MAG TPA: hypothetical protein VGF67_32430 [Ktedonobacteraceae bacterium]|jgi:hypothetical protein